MTVKETWLEGTGNDWGRKALERQTRKRQHCQLRYLEFACEDIFECLQVLSVKETLEPGIFNLWQAVD